MTILNKIAMSIFFVMSGVMMRAVPMSQLQSLHVVEGDFAAQAVLSFSGPVSYEQSASEETHELRMHISPAVYGALSSHECVERLTALRIDDERPIHRVEVVAQDGVLDVVVAFAPQQVLVRLSKSEDGRDVVMDMYSRRKLEAKRNQLDGPLYVAANDDQFVSSLYQKKKNNKHKQLRVVIDAGHGGSANGAVGLHGLVEKDLTLDVAKRVYALLKKAGYKVYLTRTDDTALNLYDRVAFAQKKHADLFVSVHANSTGGSSQAQGIETFCCEGQPLWKLKTMTRVPRFLFAHNNKKLVDMADHLDRLKSFFSFHLAQSLQTSLLKTLGKRKPPVSDRGVKQAGFVVLARNTMPAALVEIGFITNPQEAQYLSNSAYRSLLAYGISRGIHNFARHHG